MFKKKEKKNRFTRGMGEHTPARAPLVTPRQGREHLEALANSKTGMAYPFFPLTKGNSCLKK